MKSLVYQKLEKPGLKHKNVGDLVPGGQILSDGYDEEYDCLILDKVYKATDVVESQMRQGSITAD